MLEDDDIRDMFGSVLGTMYGAAVLTRYTTSSVRDPVTGVFPRTGTNHNVMVQRDACTQSQRSQKGYLEKDVRFMVLQSGVTVVPAADDQIVHRGETFSVMEIEEDPFRVYWDIRARRK